MRSSDQVAIAASTVQPAPAPVHLSTISHPPTTQPEACTQMCEMRHTQFPTSPKIKENAAFRVTSGGAVPRNRHPRDKAVRAALAGAAAAMSAAAALIAAVTATTPASARPRLRRLRARRHVRRCRCCTRQQRPSPEQEDEALASAEAEILEPQLAAGTLLGALHSRPVLQGRHLADTDKGYIRDEEGTLPDRRRLFAGTQLEGQDQVVDPAQHILREVLAGLSDLQRSHAVRG